MSGQPIIIEVVSDVVCPWCFIGKRRLEKALALLGRKNVRVHWKPFELNPDAPKEGMNRAAYRARKFGSTAHAQQLETHVVEAGTEEGIGFRFDRIERVPNTFDAHRLIWLAGQEGVQEAVVENLFRAYFIDAEDVGKSEVLKRMGVQSGLDSGRVEQLLAGDPGRNEVLAEERKARSHGISGVPTFFVNGQPVMSGAQKPDLLASVLAPVLGQRSLEGGACV
ncbi:MAG: disulfide bond formation protein DsbA [Acidobacteria bacterium]|nr:MAG: disulfide bond formation protein DsbA [Acidobacteriota bacterium]